MGPRAPSHGQASSKDAALVSRAYHPHTRQRLVEAGLPRQRQRHVQAGQRALLLWCSEQQPLQPPATSMPRSGILVTPLRGTSFKYKCRPVDGSPRMQNYADLPSPAPRARRGARTQQAIRGDGVHNAAAALHALLQIYPTLTYTRTQQAARGDGVRDAAAALNAARHLLHLALARAHQLHHLRAQPVSFYPDPTLPYP